MVKIISISITDAQKKFLEDNEHLSPSTIFQENLNKIIEFQQLNQSKITDMQRKLQFMQVNYSKAIEFISNFEKLKEFNDYVSEKDKNA